MGVEAKVDALLRVVAECGEDRVPADEPQLRVRLQDPTAAITARAAAEAGLLAATTSGWTLTPMGQERATSALRRHRVIEAFLAQVLGLAWADIHAEACRWESVAGDIVVAKMSRRLRDQVSSPYGGPIPLSAETTPPAPPAHAVSLAEVADSSPRPVRLVRVGELLQGDPDQLPRLAEAGCFPGVEMLAAGDDGSAWVEAPGGTVRLPPPYAAALFVEPVHPG